MTSGNPGSSLTNLEAEAALIGSAMCDSLVIDRVAELISPEGFGLPLHARMWSAITRERDAGRHPSPVTLRSYFEDDPDIGELGGVSYLARLTSGPGVLVIPAHELAAHITELASRRRLRAGLSGIAERCADLDAPVAELVSEVDDVIRAPSDQVTRESTAGEAMDIFITSLDEPQTGVACGIIPELDELLGELRPGSFNIVAARPGMGKTAQALSYARGAAQRGHGVQFFSLEMDQVDLVGRVAADMSFDLPACDRVPYRMIQERRLSPDQRAIVGRASRRLHEIPLSIVATGSLTIGRLRARVRARKRRLAANGQSLDLVVVDYLQLLHPDRPTRSAYESVSEISRGLKALAMDEQVAVIALAQLSREVEKRQDKRPQLSDLRDSGQIEQDADSVLFLYRWEYYLRQSEPSSGSDDEYAKWEAEIRRVEGVLEFILAKRRNGSIGNAFGRFYGVYQAVRGAP